MGRERDAKRVAERGDAARLGEAAAVSEVELTDFAAAGGKQVAEGREVCQPLAGGDRVETAALIVARPSIDSGQHGSSRK